MPGGAAQKLRDSLTDPASWEWVSPCKREDQPWTEGPLLFLDQGLRYVRDHGDARFHDLQLIRIQSTAKRLIR